MLKGLGVTGPMESAVEILEIPLDSLVLDPNLNLRDRLDDFTVERYADSWQRLPPITVYDVDGRLLLSDGFHRHAAAVMLGKKVAECLPSRFETASLFLHDLLSNGFWLVVVGKSSRRCEKHGHSCCNDFSHVE